MQKGEPVWAELKEFGAGWWINNINILKRTMEKVGNYVIGCHDYSFLSVLSFPHSKFNFIIYGLRLHFKILNDTALISKSFKVYNYL